MKNKHRESLDLPLLSQRVNRLVRYQLVLFACFCYGKMCPNVSEKTAKHEIF